MNCDFLKEYLLIGKHNLFLATVDKEIYTKLFF